MESYTLDAASELTGINYQLAGNSLGNLTYSYDLAGRRTSVGGSFARTGIPLPISTTAYNAADELTQWGTARVTYDANGNMLSSGTDGYTWDARNHLASTLSGASFKYDPFGRRVSKTISGATTSFLYDGLNPAQELSGTTPTANLLTGLGIDEFFARTDSAGARNFLTDALGSTTALTDSTGTLQTTYTYEPFGNTTVNGQASANPYQYTGRENDATGLYFYRARYYSPAIQRFISQDPAGCAACSNPYEYADDSPTDFFDPLGLQTAAAVENPPEAPPEPAPGPSRISPPVVPPAGPSIGLGNALGAIPLIFAFPQDLNPNEPDPGANPLPGRARSGNKGKWYCKVKCAKYTAPGGEGAGWHYGEGYGNTPREAYENAKKNASNTTPRGFQTKHCHAIIMQRR